jgi:hypothetical protein
VGAESSGGRTAGRTAAPSELVGRLVFGEHRLEEPKEKPPAEAGGSQGYREERYMCLWEGGRTHQAPIGTLNRVEAVSITWATPTPTRKIAEPHSPVASPITRPPIVAAAASM